MAHRKCTGGYGGFRRFAISIGGEFYSETEMLQQIHTYSCRSLMLAIVTEQL